MNDHPPDPRWHRIVAEQHFANHGAPLRVTQVSHTERVGLHDHDFIELVAVVRGSASHHTVGGRSTVRRGDVFLLLPGQWHGYEPGEELEIWNCCFGVGLLARELAWVRSDPLIGALFPGRLPGPGEMAFAARQEVVAVRAGEREFADLLAPLEALKELTARRDRVGGRAEEIAHLLLLLGRVARVRGGALRAGDDRGADPAVQAVMEALAGDLAHAWTLDALAGKVQLSRSYLVRLFRRHTGLSPMAWLAQRRAEQAAVLLLTTASGIAEIGTGVGWADPGYFARRFRAAFGMSASDYRARFPLPAVPRKRLER